MLKYAKIIDKNTKKADVALGGNVEYFKSIGMSLMDVTQSDIDNNWYLTEYCPLKTPEQKEEEEKERILTLSLTRADVERALYKSKGIDFDDVIELVKKYNQDLETAKENYAQKLVEYNEAVESNIEPLPEKPKEPQGSFIDLKALKIELKANNFYRGNIYLNKVATLLGFSEKQMDNFFQYNDYKYLMDDKGE